MELHHKKHHQAYVTNYNAALEKLADAEVRAGGPSRARLCTANSPWQKQDMAISLPAER